METIQRPTLYWVVAGKKGMEMWGYDSDKGVDVSKHPDVKVNIHPLHWDFQIVGHSGSGRVRVGAGCQYNPIQMVEAMYGHLRDSDSIDDDDSEVVIEFDMNSIGGEDYSGDVSDIQWNSSEGRWNDEFRADWE